MNQNIERINHTLDWSWLSAQAQWIIDQAVAIQQIPAPTFGEKTRAEHVRKMMEALQLEQVEVDDLYNVYGLIAGKKRNTNAVAVSAHTDTVFHEETDLRIRTERDLLYGPGIGDNSIGVAALLSLAAVIKQQKIALEHDLWFVANTREEGLGDLGGMKAAFARLSPTLSAVINLEGMAFGFVYHAGIAVRRLHITAKADGGHSWLNFGKSSAIHGIIELGAKITAIRPSLSPRSTFNIGMIEGGQSINTIAANAGFWLDLRSESSTALAELERQVRGLIESTARHDLSFEIEVVGDRPAGSIPPGHTLVQSALTALEQVGVRGALENGSTDANVPLAAGLPAVTIGVTRGGNAHRLDEYIETRPVASGFRQILLLALASCGYEST